MFFYISFWFMQTRRSIINKFVDSFETGYLINPQTCESFQNIYTYLEYLLVIILNWITKLICGICAGRKAYCENGIKIWKSINIERYFLFKTYPYLFTTCKTILFPFSGNTTERNDSVKNEVLLSSLSLH